MRHHYPAIQVRLFILISGLAFFPPAPSVFAVNRAVTADHTSVDRFGSIPADQIIAAANNFRIYFGHTSHGMQITIGLQVLQQNLGVPYLVAADWSLPSAANTLCIRDRTDTWAPEDFFPTVPDALAKNPEINTVMYMWCGQPETAEWQALLQDYISRMNALEQQYPKVLFIYATGNAQQTDCSGDSRNQFNIALREYCRSQGKPLFDFGDIDAWSNGEMAGYVVPNWCVHAGQSIPKEHPNYYEPNGPGHTTLASCENKGKAFWWLLANLMDTNTPVKLASFKAEVRGEGVQISWRTELEWDHLGFSLERSEDGQAFTEIDFIPAVSGGSSGQGYSYRDAKVKKGVHYFYRLKEISRDGRFEYYGPVQATVPLPNSFGLLNAYPNPFNQTTCIAYCLPADVKVQLDIVDAGGAHVRRLENGWRSKGAYEVSWDGCDDSGVVLSSGVFLVLLTTDQFRDMRKMVLMR